MSASSERLRAYYCRMAKSFIYCCEGVDEGKTKINQEKRMECYVWFQHQLKEALKKDLVDCTVFLPQVWNKLEMLLVSELYYVEKCREHKRDIRKVIGKPGEYSIIIFGSGHYGCEACKWLEEQDYSIACFADNNQILWGTKVNNIVVSSPVQTKKQFAIAKYLIANEKYSADMKEQLLKMGVEEEDICIYV